MRCTRVEKLLPLYVAGDLAGRRRAERNVTNHLATCQTCRGAAEEYEASRNLMRAAATLPPDFDGAFYEDLRRSVLNEIKRGHTPLARARFASLFNARFAYAASLVLIIATVAALSLHSYVGRKSVDATRPQSMIANTNHGRTATPVTTATPVSTQAKEDGRQTSSPLDEAAREKKVSGSQVAMSPSPLRRAINNPNAQNEAGRSVNRVKHAPSHAQRNPPAPSIAATAENAEEIAHVSNSNNSSGVTDAASEVSRIEMQTSDPNIRIIWLSPKPDAVAQPLK